MTNRISVWMNRILLILAAICSIAAIFEDGIEFNILATQLMVVVVLSTLLKQHPEDW